MHVRCGALLLVFCGCLAGQPGDRVVRNLAITLTGEGADLTIHLRNEYFSPATAWILQCETPEGGSRHYWDDQALSFDTKPLAPGQEIAFKFPQIPLSAMKKQPSEAGTCSDFHLIAAVFADGTVSGDLRWINAVVADRRQAFQDIAKATEILNSANAKGADSPAVIQQLTDWGKGEMPGGIPVRPNATYGRSWGSQSRGTAPPGMRPFRTPVPGAALWLIETQARSLQMP